MLIFISIFILVSLRSIPLKFELEMKSREIDRSSCEQASENQKSDLSKNTRERKRKFIYLLFKSRKIKGTRTLESRSCNENLKSVKKIILVERDYLHSCLNVKYSVRWRHSWLPLRRNSVVGWHSLSAHRYNTHCNKAETKKKRDFFLIIYNSTSPRIRIQEKKPIYNFSFISIASVWTWDEICKRAAWNSSRRLTTKRPTNCLKYFRGC